MEANHGQISLKWITSEHYQILLLYPLKGWPYKVVGFSTIGCHNTGFIEIHICFVHEKQCTGYHGPLTSSYSFDSIVKGFDY